MTFIYKDIIIMMQKGECRMRKYTPIIGLALGASVGTALSMAVGNIVALPICTSMGISLGLIFSSKKLSKDKTSNGELS